MAAPEEWMSRTADVAWLVTGVRRSAEAGENGDERMMLFCGVSLACDARAIGIGALLRKVRIR
jgi:hypothetical protein